jgi:hypothetical protein
MQRVGVPDQPTVALSDTSDAGPATTVHSANDRQRAQPARRGARAADAGAVDAD